MIEILENVGELHQSKYFQSEHPRVLVATMGALHDGHLQLVRRAQEISPNVMVSIFVNPTQFGPKEDFSSYPRDLNADLQLLKPLGVSSVFAPRVDDIYGENFATRIDPGPLAEHWCGKFRPGHFSGVCTVVYLLFKHTGCTHAVFGEKDFQQLQVIRRMNADLLLGVEIIPSPTVREPDGLAMSSRNRRLSAAGQKQALGLRRAICAVQAAYARGIQAADQLTSIGLDTLKSDNILNIDYFGLADPATLKPAGEIFPDTRILVAARVDGVRLIDNDALKTQ